MSKLKKNIAANFIANIWNGLMGLAFVPLYIHFIGIEAYGLVGIFYTLLTVLSFLDMGLSTTLNRELAILSVLSDKSKDINDLVRTLEIPYWIIGVLISFVIIFSAFYISNHWIRVETLPQNTVQTAVIAMGLTIAFQWPISFYSGGLMGLQRQVLLNAINIVFSTIRSGGSVLVLWMITPNVIIFFIWQTIVSVLHVFVLYLFLWRCIPKINRRAYFNYRFLNNIFSFASGMTGIAVTGLLIMQSDKIIISKLLTLEKFGYYAFSSSVAVGLQMLIKPFFSALFPRFAELVSLKDERGLIELYHKSCQLLAIIILPPSMILIFFPSEILMLWTNDAVTVSETFNIVRLLIIGNMLNGFMTIPYALTLSHGWTKITLYVHVIAIIIIIPMIIFFTLKYGLIGAPIAWIIFNSGHILITINIIHSRLLKQEKWSWYMNDVGMPLTISVLIAVIWKIFIIGADRSKFITLVLLSGTISTIFIALVFMTPFARSWSINRFYLFKNSYIK